MGSRLDDLSHHWKPNTIAERELTRARIEIEKDARVERVVDHSVTVTGKLGSFTFRRNSICWIVDGKMPLHVAEELYQDPIGREDIRINEQHDCPPPAYPLVVWELADGRRVLSSKQMDEQKRLVQIGISLASSLNSFVESDTPQAIRALGFITRYSIISGEGLRLFADTLRKHGLA